MFNNNKFRSTNKDSNFDIEETETLLMDEGDNGNDFSLENVNNRVNQNGNVLKDGYLKSYTIEDAVDYAGLGLFQLKLICKIGVISAADAMEMLLLSVLGPAIQCEWHLTPGMKALITTIVFIGFLLGSFFFGMVSDNYGRKTTFMIVISIICYMGVMTAFSPTYAWLIIFRGIVGFGIGGTTSSFTLMTEFLPSKFRAKVLIVYQVWWALGSTFEVGLAYFVLPQYGWRWLVGLSAIPILVCGLLILLLPESPRFLLSKGRVSEAQKIVDTLFKENGKPKLEGQLTQPSNNNKADFSISKLFAEEYRCTSLLLFVIWFGVTFCYYGIILINAEYFTLHPTCHPKGQTVNIQVKDMNLNFVDDSCCERLQDSDYKSMIISSFGEFCIIPINFYLVDVIGRTKLISTQFLLTGILYFLLYICMPKMLATTLMFGIRGFVCGIFNITYIYTSEVYPTVIRSTATGLCSSFARLAAILTPFVAQVFIPQVSFLFGLMIYGFLALICFISAMCLPIETRGRPMPENFSEIEIEMTER